MIVDYLADSVDAFLTTHATTEYASPQDNSHTSATNTNVVHLGFTFSFPVAQAALDSGKLLTWTKGFKVKHVVGEDVVKLLQDAFDRKRMNVRCVALVNDVSSGPDYDKLFEKLTFILETVGTLLSRSYTAGGCIAGCIYGTGTNGAYVEQVGEQRMVDYTTPFYSPVPSANIPKLAGTPVAKKGGLMVINCEWGAFDSSVRFNDFSKLSLIHASLAFASSINTLRQRPRSLERESEIPGI